MIKQLLLSILSFFCSLVVYCQLYNNGATITIQNGAYLMIAGNLQNASGTITNDGKIEVQGNFINAATYISTGNEDSLIMSGTGIDTLTAGSSAINYLTINKTTSADIVRLGGTTTINTKLDYLSGVFTTDPILNSSFTLTSPVNAVYNFAAGEEIIGSVKRTGWSNGNAYVFNQPNMQVATNGGTTPTDFTVTMIPQSGGGDPTQNERELKRKFLFAQTGGSGFTADISFPYATSELNTNVEANVVPWKLISSEWNARLTPVIHDVANHFVSTTGIPASDLALEWKLADPKYTFNVTAFLRGAWTFGPNMTTGLNSVFPLSQPYNDAAFGSYNGGESVSAGFFASHTNIVDWVLIDLRKPSTGFPTDATSSTFIGRKAAFLLNTGVLVDLDGTTPLAFNISKQGAGFIVVRHRNHLAVMSNSSPSNATGFYTNDFSTLAGAYHNPSISSDQEQVLPGSSKYGLWAGNANKDATMNSSDIALVKSNVNAALTGYVFGDVNLDQTLNIGDVALTKVGINNAAQSHSSLPVGINNNNTGPKSHVPE
jgi:hypothetical protein